MEQAKLDKLVAIIVDILNAIPNCRAIADKCSAAPHTYSIFFECNCIKTIDDIADRQIGINSRVDIISKQFYVADPQVQSLLPDSLYLRIVLLRTYPDPRPVTEMLSSVAEMLAYSIPDPEKAKRFIERVRSVYSS